jgi:hypothetical protein
MTIQIYLAEKLNNREIKTFCNKNNIHLYTRKKITVDFFKNIDAVVLEVTEPSQEIRFIITHMLLLQKPTLCLYKKTSPPKQLLQDLEAKARRSMIQYDFYTPETVDVILSQFLIDQRLTFASKLHTTQS